MPPKPKKKKSRGEKRAISSQSRPSTGDSTPAPFFTDDAEFFKNSILEHKDRIQTLLTEKNALAEKLLKNEVDSREIAGFLNREVASKDESIYLLQEKLELKEEELRKTKEEMEVKMNKKLKDMDLTFKEREIELKQRIAELDEDNRVLNKFRNSKMELETELSSWKSEVEKIQQRTREFENQMEMKFMVEKERLQREFEQRVEQMRKAAKGEAVKALSTESKRVILQNRIINEELNVQIQTTELLKRDKSGLEDDCRRLERDAGLSLEKEQEYAKKQFKQTKKIQDLEAKLKVFERSLSQVVRDFEKEREGLKIRHQQELESQQGELTALRELVRLKDKELKNIKKLAQMILDQRTEVEQFFLESLEHVKTEVRKRIEDESGSGSRNKLALSLPNIKGSKGISSLLSSTNQQPNGSSKLLLTDVSTKVDLSDLDWDDKERVLRILFAKINYGREADKTAAAALQMSPSSFPFGTQHSQQVPLRAAALPSTVPSQQPLALTQEPLDGSSPGRRQR
eukprot:GILJ01004300.1.p1 GENE.GILJ01004300.1~~GILJ01004300.1.p1  ORF type:complete len:515 (-),score=104.35 GILJ01004300.1:281-1825(-)